MNRLADIHLDSSVLSSRGRISAYAALVLLLILYIGTMAPASNLKARYTSLLGTSWQDRTGMPLDAASNAKGNFMMLSPEIPARFEMLLLRKEDRYFYYHPGINPISSLRGFVTWVETGKAQGGSTITQQLVKLLLGHERDRTVGNKLLESFYSISLELHSSKRDILSMYEQMVYFGKNRQGVARAAWYFFNKAPLELIEPEMLQLIAALGSPSTSFPGSERNAARLPLVAQAVQSSAASISSSGLAIPSAASLSDTSFELKTLGLSCNPCALTIDAALTERIRGALRRRIASASKAHVHSGAVVVLKIPENELLAIVGSPDPSATADGAQINMATQPRPIGSTVKPFMYLTAFMKGARPYTLVLDREYGYTIGTGFAFYPKNFDGKFRGIVTLHEALSNSLNVPAVKVLEYAGLSNFYSFLEDSLGFLPLQPLSRYELGIALGALEMDLLTLTHFFSIFPNHGILRPLTLEKGGPGDFQAPMEKEAIGEKRVADPVFIELVNRILSDRETAVEQFGLRSSLTLPQKNYALKTGTSRDYHDSWVVGFTPDFLVGVWLGNSDNTPMREVTGQTGAGAVFEDVMTLLYASPYNRGTPFPFDRLKEYSQSGTIEYGLADDDYDATKNLLLESALILSPHDGDTILLARETVIPLKARETVDWFVDGAFVARAKETRFSPSRAGHLVIEARGALKTESVRIVITSEL